MACAVLAITSVASAAEPSLAFFQSGPGRFEVAATNADTARVVTTAADEMWRTLALPLGLPDGFSTPVLVRVVPAAEWREATPFRVLVEAGGIVSVRLGESDLAGSETILKRALVQGLLMRLAVARHGVNSRLAAPLWLELACVGWWQTQWEPAQLDALKHESAAVSPPALAALLTWTRGAEEARAGAIGATWLMAFLRGEAEKIGEWNSFVQRLLGGEEALAALAASYPGRFRNHEERELWWQTGWHALRTARTLPVLGVAESRRELETLTRFVFSAEGRDVVVPLRAVLAQGKEPHIAADLAQRAAELNRVLPALHPFHRNAGLALAEVFATREATDARRDEACRQFAADWQAGIDLAVASASVLDGWENRTGTAAPGARGP